LRAPLEPQLDRTDALVVIGDGSAAQTVAAAVASRGKPVMSARIEPDPVSLEQLAGKRVLAFAGIGDPGRFFRTLRDHGIEVVSEKVFDDHHAFSPDEIDGLIAAASRDGLTLVTTEKDIARLRGAEDAARLTRGIVAFAVKLVFADAPALRKFIVDRLFNARQRKFRS
jgi:tetraacyldisaccharide 4'-kinase